MGIAPNQQPIKFEIATENPIAVEEGAGGYVGNNVADSEVTARMLCTSQPRIATVDFHLC